MEIRSRYYTNHKYIAKSNTQNSQSVSFAANKKVNLLRGLRYKYIKVRRSDIGKDIVKGGKTELGYLIIATIIPKPAHDIHLKYSAIKFLFDTVKIIHANIYTHSSMPETRQIIRKHYPSNIFRPILAAIDFTVDNAAKGINAVKKLVNPAK